MAEAKIDKTEESLELWNKLSTRENSMCVLTDGQRSQRRVYVVQNQKLETEVSSVDAKEYNRQVAKWRGFELGLNVVDDQASTTDMKQFHLFTDSDYVHGVLNKNYKVKANKELIASIQRLMDTIKQEHELKVLECHWISSKMKNKHWQRLQRATKQSVPFNTRHVVWK